MTLTYTTARLAVRTKFLFSRVSPAWPCPGDCSPSWVSPTHVPGGLSLLHGRPCAAKLFVYYDKYLYIHTADFRRRLQWVRKDNAHRLPQWQEVHWPHRGRRPRQRSVGRPAEVHGARGTAVALTDPQFQPRLSAQRRVYMALRLRAPARQHVRNAQRSRDAHVCS